LASLLKYTWHNSVIKLRGYKQMPIPLIPVIAAWVAGGTLVSHAAGGLIVTGAGGYVAGTYLSCTALTAIAAASTAVAGTCAAAAAVVANTIGATSATVATAATAAGTTVASAAGAKGALITAGMLPAAPIWVPIAVTGVALGCGYGGYRILKQKGYFDRTSER
jgi:hypothetical protein